MASLFNTKISNTYVGLIKTIDNAVISSSLRELTDGSGNATGIHLNNAGDFKVTNILEFGSLKDTGENITITKFVDEADGIGNNDNDTSIPTSAAVKDFVTSQITLEDLDFRGDDASVQSSVDLDSQVFAILGTANEIETSTSVGSQQLQIGLPTNVTIGGNLSFGDSGKARFGASNDLEIFHDGSNSRINETGTGNLIIQSTNFQLLKGDGGEYIMQGISDAEVSLYYDGSKKFETTNTGVKVTGVVVSDGLSMGDNEQIRLGDGEDLRLFHNGTDSSINNYNGDLYITNQADNKDIILRTDDGGGGFTPYLTIDGGDERVNFSKNAGFSDNVRAMFGDGLDLRIYHDASNSYIQAEGTGHLYIEQKTDDKDIIFQSDDGSGGLSTYFYLDGGGTLTRFEKRLRMQDNIQFQVGSAGDFEIYHNGTNTTIQNYTGNLTLRNDQNNGIIEFACDDGSGGVTPYLKLDGSNPTVVFSKSAIFTDNIAAYFGTGLDLQIYHDGTNSYIQDSGTGNLRIASDIVHLNNAASTEVMLKAIENGAVELYYDDSKKFETSSTGVTVTGVAVTDGLDLGDNEKIRLGDSQDLEIYHDSSSSYIKNNTGNLNIQEIAGGSIFFEKTDGENMAVFRTDAECELYYDGTEKFATTSTGVSVTGITDTDGITSSAEIDVNLATEGTYFEGGSGNIRRLTITSGTNISGHAKHTFNIGSGNGKYEFNIGGSNEFSLDANNASLGGNLTVAGDLTVNGTTTTVNTSTLAVEDPLISMAKDNSSNSVDIGFYGKYNDGINRYLGLFADASNSNKFKLFRGLTAEPTTTVDTTDAGYQEADLQIRELISSSIYASSTGNFLGNGAAALKWGNTVAIGTLTYDSTHPIIRAESGKSLIFDTNGANTALTLDTSQNATFAGNINTGKNKYLRFTGESSGSDASILFGNSAGTGGSLTFKRNSDANAILTLNADGKIDISGHGTEGAYIKSKGSIRLDIDNDNDHTDRSFIVSSNNATSDLLTITETGSATFTGSVNINNSSGDTLTLTKGTTEPSLRIEGDTDKDFVITVSGELLTFTQNDGATDILTLDHDTKDATFASSVSAVADTYSSGASEIIYKAERTGGAVAGDWSYDDGTTDMSLGTSTSHSFSLKTGNTRALTIDTSQNATFAGNLLIPTSAGAISGSSYPYTTYIGSTANATSTHLQAGSSDKTEIKLYGGDVGDKIEFTTNSTVRATITTAGEIQVTQGLKTVASNTSTNATASSDFGLKLQNTSNTDGNFQSIDFFNSTGFITGRIGAQFQDAGDRNTDLYFATRANSGALTERFRIASDGSSTFAGNVTLSSSSSPSLAITDTTNTVTLKAYSQDANSHIGTVTNHPLIIDTNNTAAITISTGQLVTFSGNVNLADNKKLRLGDSEDFQIYHDGSHSFIDNTKGYTYLRNTGADSQGIIIRNDDAGDIHLDNDFAGNIIFSTSATNRMILNSSGELKINKSIHLGNDSEVLTPSQYSMLIEAPSGTSTNINMYTFGASVFNIASDGTTATVGWGSTQEREVNLVNTGTGNVKVGINNGAPSSVLSVKTLQDSSFDEGIGVIRSNSSQTGYINMVGGAMNINAPADIPIKFRDNGTTNVEIKANGVLCQKGKAKTASIVEDMKYFTATNTNGSSGTSTNIDFDISEYGIGTSGYVNVEISASGYGSSGSAGMIFQYQAGGYSNHTIGNSYHPNQVFVNTSSGCTVSVRNPSASVYGITVNNVTAGNQTVAGIIRIKVTSNY